MDCCYRMTTYKRKRTGAAIWGTAERRTCPYLATRLINGKPYCANHAPSKAKRNLPFVIEPLRHTQPQEAI